MSAVYFVRMYEGEKKEMRGKTGVLMGVCVCSCMCSYVCDIPESPYAWAALSW